jgi:hypothetical protein
VIFYFSILERDCRSHDRMAVGFTTICAISELWVRFKLTACEQTTIDETNSSYLSLDGSTYNETNLSKEWSICICLWRLMSLSTIFQLYHGRSVVLVEETGVPEKSI